jgi:hypothetical protein
VEDCLRESAHAPPISEPVAPGRNTAAIGNWKRAMELMLHAAVADQDNGSS